MCKCKSRPPGVQGWRRASRDPALLVHPGAVPGQLQAPRCFPFSSEPAIRPLFPLEEPLQRRPLVLSDPLDGACDKPRAGFCVNSILGGRYGDRPVLRQRQAWKVPVLIKTATYQSGALCAFLASPCLPCAEASLQIRLENCPGCEPPDMEETPPEVAEHEGSSERGGFGLPALSR